jgi:hypothetical protein
MVDKPIASPRVMSIRSAITNSSRARRTKVARQTLAGAMVQESFSGFCKRTATLPSDDSGILEQSFEHSRISFWKGEARQVSTIYLCDVRRGPHDHGKGIIR